jgi:hypothetical protein
MRVLLDECVPRALRKELPGHEVKTVAEAGWAGVKNGELLQLAASQFDLLTVTLLIGFLVISAVTAPNAVSFSAEFVNETAGTPPSNRSTADENNSAACEAKLRAFVSELDIMLDSRPPSIDPFLVLIKKYFPLKSCNIDEATTLQPIEVRDAWSPNMARTRVFI